MKLFTRFLAGLLFILFFSSSLSFSALSTKNQAPDLLGSKNWLDTSQKITLKSLEGRVIVLCFWSPSDTQSLREILILSKWYKIYNVSAPLEILGISVPEFEFQKDTASLEAVLRKLKIPFPVTFDADRTLQSAYQVRSIPTVFLVDHQGQIRAAFPGEINYEQLEDQIQTLLHEIPNREQIPFIQKAHIPHFKIIPELYFGYKKSFGYGNSEKLRSETTVRFQYPDNITRFQFYLHGDWRVKEESLEAAAPHASFKIPFEAQRAHLLAGSARKSAVPAEVRLNGLPISNDVKGKDVIFQEGRSYILIRDYRFYKLLKFKRKSGEHFLEIILEEPGAEFFKAGFE